MSRPQLLWVLDRVPRYVSLLGLLGLIGLAGLFDPAWYRLSALSFLSYLAFLRFFRRFIDPWLLSISPWLGCVGFAGWCALYDPAPTAPRTPLA